MLLKYSAAAGEGAPGAGATATAAAAATAFRAGVLANANRGGENVASGALIGAVLGASCGFSGLPADLLAGLCPGQRQQIDAEVDAFLEAAPPFVHAEAVEDQGPAAAAAAAAEQAAPKRGL